MRQILLATDLDRTILPNGEWDESPRARELFKRLAARDEVVLAYVSGRDRELQQDAIVKYDLPLPDYAIGDVGTTLYQVGPQALWEPLTSWEAEISTDWRGKNWDDVQPLFDEVPGLRLQDDSPAKQNTHKVSYYTAPDIDKNDLIAELQKIVDAAGIKASLIWSIDAERNVGLLDVLPLSARKLHAVQFLRAHLGVSEDETVFAGDSGNDLPALTSGLQAIAVKNTPQEVKDEAQATLAENGLSDRLYVAVGGFMDMNGNYSAGVLEGVAHYFPEVADWLQLSE